MGVVYKAQDTLLLRLVAIKFLSPHLVVDEENRRRFIREARAASALNHPNVCTIYDIGQFDSTFFIVMEYVDGLTLREILKHRGPLPESEVAEIGLQICDALAVIHTTGLIHRDIKPDNIMLLSTGQIKIMDFGLAKLIESGAQQEKFSKPVTQLASTFDSVRISLSSFEGTALYMAPEQIQKGPIDARTDVYALGALMYELLAGKPPFENEEYLSLMTAIVRQEPQKLSSTRRGISDRMEATVLQCLSKSPHARPQSMGDLCQELRKIAFPAIYRKPKRSIWGFVSVASAILLAILGIFLLTNPTLPPSVPQLKLKALSMTGVLAYAPDFSPDGTRITYVATRSDDNSPRKLLLKDLESGKFKLLFESYIDQDGRRRDPFAPDWSPDGEWIAFNFRDG